MNATQCRCKPAECPTLLLQIGQGLQPESTEQKTCSPIRMAPEPTKLCLRVSAPDRRRKTSQRNAYAVKSGNAGMQKRSSSISHLLSCTKDKARAPCLRSSCREQALRSAHQAAHSLLLRRCSVYIGKGGCLA